MIDLNRLRNLIGAQALSDHMVAAARALTSAGLDEKAAFEAVTEAADAGQPWAIASTCQRWDRRADVNPSRVPVRRLYIVERTRTGVVAMYSRIDEDVHDLYGDTVAPPDTPSARGVRCYKEIPFEVLQCFYNLTAWRPFEHLLPSAAFPIPDDTGRRLD
ncbi:hypothetical protein ABZ891_32020 [Streptomyces sp. NPDC047023]|uniref:hypothetical protein n=1 Tax=Streptomyces sp. NPDC047023 TaxID=3155139 RepID=UPI0033D76C11